MNLNWYPVISCINFLLHISKNPIDHQFMYEPSSWYYVKVFCATPQISKQQYILFVCAQILLILAPSVETNLKQQNNMKKWEYMRFEFVWFIVLLYGCFFNVCILYLHFYDISLSNECFDGMQILMQVWQELFISRERKLLSINGNHGRKFRWFLIVWYYI